MAETQPAPLGPSLEAGSHAGSLIGVQLIILTNFTNFMVFLKTFLEGKLCSHIAELSNPTKKLKNKIIISCDNVLIFFFFFFFHFKILCCISGLRKVVTLARPRVWW